MKKRIRSIAARHERRRPDAFSDKVNGSLNGFFKKAEKIEKVTKAAGLLVTVAFSVYGLIPKRDALPAADNQIYETMSE